MSRLFDALGLIAVWIITSAIVYFPFLLSGNSVLIVGYALFAIAGLVAAFVAHSNRRESMSYALAAAPSIVAAIVWSLTDLARRA